MLTRQDLKAYCQSKKGAEETYPFGDSPVYKVRGKMFALITAEGNPVRISLKSEPALIKLQRDTYPAVTTAPYMDKNHWNGVAIDGTIPEEEIFEMIDDSYRLVVKGLRKADREALENT